MRLQYKVLVGLLMFSLAATPFAQGRSMNNTIEGSGRFTLSGERFDLNRATLVLGNRGEMEFVVYGRRTHRFEGRYTSLGDGRVRLNIERMGDRSASGTATALYDRRFRLARLEGSGSSSRGSWSVDFRSDADADDWAGNRPDDWKPGGGPLLNGTRSGDGRFNRNGGQRDLSRATVRMERDGDLEISMSGDGATYNFRGRWTDAGSRGYRITISSGLGSSRTDGTGTISRRGNAFTTIEITGRDGDNRRYEARFNASGSGWGSSGGDDGDWSSGSWQNSRITRKGVGDLRSETGQRFRIDSAWVNFESNGKFQLEIRGERTYKFAGTWRRTSDHTADLRITSGYGPIYGLGDATGTGRIWFTGNRFSGFEFKTKSDGIDRTITFRAD